MYTVYSSKYCFRWFIIPCVSLLNNTLEKKLWLFGQIGAFLPCENWPFPGRQAHWPIWVNHWTENLFWFSSMATAGTALNLRATNKYILVAADYCCSIFWPDVVKNIKWTWIIIIKLQWLGNECWMNSFYIQSLWEMSTKWIVIDNIA